MKRRYLITGAQGLIGRYLTARILAGEPDAEVLGIGRSGRLDGFFTHRVRPGGPYAPVPEALRADFGPRHRYQAVPLLDTQQLRDAIGEFQPRYVFHLASALHSAAERDLLRTNVAGTASLLDALAEVRPLLVLGSSGSVYGEAVSLPVSEDHPCAPVTLYGVTKLAAEHLARVKGARSGVPVVTARIFNVVGPGQDDTHVCGGFAARLAALAGIPRPVLETGPLGSTRDFIDVRDVAAALLLLAHRAEPGEAYNVASGSETRIRDVLAELIRISELDVQVVEGSDGAAGVLRQVADVSLLRRLGFAPAHSLRQSLADTFRYRRSLS